MKALSASMIAPPFALPLATLPHNALSSFHQTNATHGGSPAASAGDTIDAITHFTGTLQREPNTLACQFLFLFFNRCK